MAILARTIAVLGLINGALLEVCRILCIGLVAAITTVVCAGVIWRYGLNNSLSWSEELAKFLMVWLVFLGTPIATRMGDNVAIALFPDAFPARGRSIVMLILTAVVIWFCVVFGYYSFLFAWNGWRQVAMTVQGFSLFYVFVSVPLGMALIFLVSVQVALEHLSEFLKPGSAKPDAFFEKHTRVLQNAGGE